jgi:hypothetical protein
VLYRYPRLKTTVQVSRSRLLLGLSACLPASRLNAQRRLLASCRFIFFPPRADACLRIPSIESQVAVRGVWFASFELAGLSTKCSASFPRPRGFRFQFAKYSSRTIILHVTVDETVHFNAPFAPNGTTFRFLLSRIQDALLQRTVPVPVPVSQPPTVIIVLRSFERDRCVALPVLLHLFLVVYLIRLDTNTNTHTHKHHACTLER